MRIRINILPLALLLWGLLLSVPGWAAEAGGPPPSSFTLREALRFALANSPDGAIARQRLRAAQSAIDLARSSSRPQLSFSSQYSQTDAPMYSFGNILNQGEFSNQINFNDPGRTDSVNAGVQVGLRLYDGGRDRAGVRAAASQADAARQDLSAVQARLAFEVARAFAAIVQAQEVVAANQSAVGAAAASLKVAQARQEAGVLLADAVLDLKVQRAQAEENLIRGQQGLRVARKVFLTLLGIGRGSVEVRIEPGPGEVPPPEGAAGQRFELKALDAQIKSAEAQVRQSRAGLYPAVDGFAGYQAEYGSITGGSGNAWQAGVKMRYPLSDGGRTQAEIAGSEARLEELRVQRRKLELGIGLEVEQARAALKEADERLRVTGDTVAQAEASAEINRARFGEGVALSSDLIAAENRLTGARVSRATATAGRQVAIADLRQALGLPQFDDLPSEEAPTGK